MNAPAEQHHRFGRLGAARDAREAGFTLIDTLIALAVLAVLSTLLPSALVTAREAIRQAEQWFEARLIADGLMQHLLLSGPRPGTTSGAAAGHTWQATTRFHEMPAQGATGAVYVTRIAVEVAGRRSVAFERLTFGELR
jgi:type II secretory pathway pseudopilin PulG